MPVHKFCVISFWHSKYVIWEYAFWNFLNQFDIGAASECSILYIIKVPALGNKIKWIGKYKKAGDPFSKYLAWGSSKAGSGYREDPAEVVRSRNLTGSCDSFLLGNQSTELKGFRIRLCSFLQELNFFLRNSYLL